MPPLEMEPQTTPPKEGVPFRHKSDSSGTSTPEASRQEHSPWGPNSPRCDKDMREKADDSLTMAGTPATAMSTPASSVGCTPSSSVATPSRTPRYGIRRLFADPLSTSICENDVSADISNTSMSSATSQVETVETSETTDSIRMLFQDRDDKPRGGSPIGKRRLPSRPSNLMADSNNGSPTMPAKHPFGRHARSASMYSASTFDSLPGSIPKERSYSRLHDSLSLEGSFKPSYGLSERRRSSRGQSSPNHSLDNTSISSDERFPCEQSSTPTPCVSIPKTAYVHSHHRSLSRSSHQLSQPEITDRKSTLAPVWKKPLVRLAHTRGLVWILCLVALSSLSITIVTNRSMATVPVALNPLAKEVERVPYTYTATHGARSRVASLRGNLIISAGRKARGDVPKNDPHKSKSKPKHVDDKHAAKHKNEKKKSVDVRHTRSVHVDKKTNSPISLTALSQLKQHKQSAGEKQPSKHHAHEASNPEIHMTQHESKHPSMVKAKKESISRMAAPPRRLPRVILPKKRMNSVARFESQDRRMFRQSLKEQTSDEASRRVVFLHDSVAHMPRSNRKIHLYRSDFTDNTQLYSILDSDDERVKSMELREPYEQGECVPMQDWQTTFHPSCNGVHEIGLADLGEENGDDARLFGTNGYWRNAWKVDLMAGEQEISERDTVVLKTLKIHHRFEEAHFEHDRIDAVAMERLTSSPHVINVFGFCGHSVMTEYADGKRLGELADKSRKKPLERLKIARDIAAGLADVHGIDGDGNSTFVHLDINPANVVSVSGRLKLNDFNIGIIRRWNTTSNTPCGFPAQYPNPQWRSPEEARDEQNLTEKVDIFSMGHIFFRLICGHEPWNKLEAGGKPSKVQVNEKVRKGVLPAIPQAILETDSSEIAAIRDAMLGCYTFDPAKRPSAREISNALQVALDKLEDSSPLSIS